MSLTALIIAIIALILAYKAYTRSGGNLEEIRADINDRLSTEKLRKTMADVLHKAEQSVRGDEQAQQDEEDKPKDGGE